jgi:hypothetical protein
LPQVPAGLLHAIQRYGDARADEDADGGAAFLGVVIKLIRAALAAPPAAAPTDEVDLVPGAWPIIALGKGLIEVAEGSQDGVPALIFGINGTGVIGEPTKPDRTHLPGETLAVVTFGNVASLDVVANKLAVLRAKMAPHSPPAAAATPTKPPALHLTVAELREAAHFTEGDELDTDVVLSRLPARMSIENEPMAEGLYLWWDDIADEGCVGPLGDEAFCASATPAAATPIAPEAEHGSGDLVERPVPPAAALGRGTGEDALVMESLRRAVFALDAAEALAEHAGYGGHALGLMAACKSSVESTIKELS